MNINDIGNWVKLAEQITTGSWDNYNIDNLFIYKSIAVVSHSNDGSFSTYVMPVSLFTGTTFQVPFGGTPPQGNGF